jgi:hypothetical protein
MVGPNTKIENLQEWTAQYVGKPFRKITCMGLIDIYLRDLGMIPPKEFEGLTLDNFMTEYRKNPYPVQLTMMRLIRSLGKHVPAAFPKIGDLLVISQRLRRKFVVPPGFFCGIYVGHGMAISSFIRSGVTVFNLDNNQKAIVARRVA